MNNKQLGIYRDALINISKWAGKCWDGNRECRDSQFVADQALKKADPKLFAKIDNMKYTSFKVLRNGRVRYNGR
jgi:hypothetical protein